MRSSMPDARPAGVLGERARSASLASETGTSRPSAASTMPPKETSCHSRLGASRIRPSLRRTRPGTLIPMPTSGAGAGASSTTVRISAATDAPTCQASPSLVHRRLRALQDPAAEADPGHDGPVDTQVDRDDVGPVLGDPDPGRRADRLPGGRPRAGAPAPRCRATPARRRGPAMVLRLSPIRLVSSAARSGPAPWTCRSSVPRLWRRMASWSVPRPERRCGLM